MKTEKELAKMSFEQLIKWSESEDSIDAPPTLWQSWRSEVKHKAEKFFFNKDFSELEKFYRDHPHEDIPAWSDAWFEAIKESWPFSEIFERLEAFATTLDVILKKIGHQDSGITINQLARLKGGHAV